MLRNSCYNKGIVLVTIVLFLSVAVTPTIGISNNDDTTPPVTTISFDPSEPDGKNGWYISDVTVSLNATDDMSGVNVTYYRIDDGVWLIYEHYFIICEDGDDILIEFYSIDRAGNVEDVKSSTLDIDQTKPIVWLYYEIIGGNQREGWDFIFTAEAYDDYSGMERVEFYLYNELKKNITGPGPIYEWEFHYPYIYSVRGFILNKNITEEYVNIFALIVRISGSETSPDITVYAYDNAGNMVIVYFPSPSYPTTIANGIYLFRRLILPNNYSGYIGNYFILAVFDTS